jgi:hypothetical protein
VLRAVAAVCLLLSAIPASAETLFQKHFLKGLAEPLVHGLSPEFGDFKSIVARDKTIYAHKTDGVHFEFKKVIGASIWTIDEAVFDPPRPNRSDLGEQYPWFNNMSDVEAAIFDFKKWVDAQPEATVLPACYTKNNNDFTHLMVAVFQPNTDSQVFAVLSVKRVSQSSTDGLPTGEYVVVVANVITSVLIEDLKCF